MRSINILILICSSLLSLATANVEKVIFLAPEAQSFPTDASLDNLLLNRLTLGQPTVRTYLNASFPIDDQPKGTETWLLLEDLTPGQRYEVRICWLATQPTSFWLYTHTMQSVFETPELITALTLYSNSRAESIAPVELQEARARTDLRRRSTSKTPTTFLFLQVSAMADYFSLNKTLMERVPPVHVDIILDPYLLNVFPQSLLPTAAYVVILAFVGWFVSGWLYRGFVAPFVGRSAALESKKSD